MAYDNVTVKDAHTPVIPEDLTGRPEQPYEEGQTSDTLDMVRQYWEEAKILQATERYESALDQDFYDGLQWTLQDQQILQERGQAALVINQIKPTIDLLVGTEKRTRVDFNVLPRKNSKQDIIAARAKTQLMKAITAASYGRMEKSAAFKDQITAGVGWMEVGVSHDADNPIFMKRIDWRNMWYDRKSRSPFLRDCRYVIRSKWIDLDIAQGMWPDKEAELKTYARLREVDDEFIGRHYNQDNGTQVLEDFNMLNGVRPAVRVQECWYRKPGKRKIVRGGFYEGSFQDNADKEFLNSEIDAGKATIVENSGLFVKYAIFTGNIMLAEGDSPYNHSMFPFIPVFGYRRSGDGSVYGAIRNVRGVQEDLNKRRSKALHILSSNVVIADADAASPEGWNQIEDEISRADGIVKLDGRRGARFEQTSDRNLAEEHITLMQSDEAAIRAIAGATEENLGNNTSTLTTPAIRAKQNQGSTTSAEIFDNYRFSQQLLGEVTLSLIEQFHLDEKTIRIQGTQGGYSHVTVNRQHDGVVENDIASAKSDFVISEQDYNATMRASMFEQLSEFTSKLGPEVGIQLLDLIVDMSDLPNKDELADRIRTVNGQKPPQGDADIEDKLDKTPEEQADEQKQAQQEQQQAQIDMQKMQLELAEMKAKVDNLVADTRLKDSKSNTEFSKAKESDTRSRRTESDQNLKVRKTSVEMAQSLGLAHDANRKV